MAAHAQVRILPLAPFLITKENMISYSITLTPDSNDTLLVGFPDFPEANSVGDDREQALFNAMDALETVIDIYMSHNKKIPLPTYNFSYDAMLNVSGSLESKILNWNSMF